MMTRELAGFKILIKGIVQGVGFRPFVYSLATQNNLTGWVRNTSGGVEIEVNGEPASLDAFLSALQKNPPPLARIDHLEYHPCLPNGYPDFEIIPSQPEPGAFIPISPDISICRDCQRELFDPANRRYRYPFINCTNCGPRFTITQDIPYDRPKTTMAVFTMCPDCQAEYLNPQDRRFHAQPIACPVCGPHVRLEVNGSVLGEREDALQKARAMLQDGKILAVKGLGGFHLACDATDHNAVNELRQRKKRSGKPFAVMACDLSAVIKHCQLTELEVELLFSHQRPIVLLQRRRDSDIAIEIAPNQNTLGMMLPYTPLHMLLLERAPGFPEVLVMTSGNLSEEPIAYDDEEACSRLKNIADAFLIHNRRIHMRVDDSVTRIFPGPWREDSPNAEENRQSLFSKTYLIRRARGYAPDPIQLNQELPPILATGAELKNTFCLTQNKYAFVSHYIGDMENYETLRSFEEGIRHYEQLFRIKPQILACDLHPNYLATRYAEQRAQEQSLPLVKVQHHHAHLAACLADNHWDSREPVIGLSFDGTGLGTDNTIWGGEFLLGNYRSFRRMFHLAYVPLAGSDQAVRKPARMALAHLWQAGLGWEDDLEPVRALCPEERMAVRVQLERKLNAPLTSSMGRLFDAVSAFLGVCQTATYEGQAAIELEAIADPEEKTWYEFGLNGTTIEAETFWKSLLKDWRSGVSVPVLAARFHNSIVELACRVCREIFRQTGCRTVALSGGVWQNLFLLERAVLRLKQSGFDVLWHHRLPTNDGGIAVGQALAAAQAVNANSDSDALGES